MNRNRMISSKAYKKWTYSLCMLCMGLWVLSIPVRATGLQEDIEEYTYAMETDSEETEVGDEEISDFPVNVSEDVIENTEEALGIDILKMESSDEKSDIDIMEMVPTDKIPGTDIEEIESVDDAEDEFDIDSYMRLEEIDNPEEDPQWWREMVVKRKAADYASFNEDGELMVNYEEGEYVADEIGNYQEMYDSEFLEEQFVYGNFGAGYTHADRFAGYQILNGIDVSKYQGDIDWQKVKADGISFAYIRVGYRGYGAEGKLSPDPYYKTNIVNAAAAGIDVGVYIFSQATTEAEAVEEANYVIDLIRGLPVSLQLILDYEFASGANGATGRLYDAHLSRDAATNVCIAFCNRVKSAGYDPMVYANKVMLTNYLDGERIANSGKVWLAQYASRATYEGTYQVWQYSSNGAVNGISGRVDMNFWYKKPPTYPIYYSLGGGTNNAKNPHSYVKGHATITLKNPSRRGYTFVKWVRTDLPVATDITQIAEGVTGEIHLKAIWKENHYTVYYHVEDSPYVVSANQVVSGNYAYTELINLYDIAQQFAVSSNYIDTTSIEGFATKPKGGKKYTVAKLASKIGNKEGEVVHLYARWGKKNYGLTYDLVGDFIDQPDAAGNPEKYTNTNVVSYTYNVKKGLTLKKPKRSGYKFAGWELVQGNAEFFDAAKGKILKGAEGDFSFKAKWTPVPYKVELKLNTKDKGITWLSGEKTTVYLTNYADTELYQVNNIFANPSERVLLELNTKANGKGISIPIDENGCISLHGLTKTKNKKVKLYYIWQK